MQWNRKSYIPFWVCQLCKSHKGAPPHEQVAFIKLKQVIYDKFVQLREFAESDLEQKKKKERFRKRM